MSHHGTQEPANDTCMTKKSGNKFDYSTIREFTGRQHPIDRARKMPTGHRLRIELEARVEARI